MSGMGWTPSGQKAWGGRRCHRYEGCRKASASWAAPSRWMTSGRGAHANGDLDLSPDKRHRLIHHDIVP
jgi:hypothetical protein